MNDINTKTYDNDKILQLLPAPEGMFFAYQDDGKARPVSCLALVELSNGDREVKAMGLKRRAYSRPKIFCMLSGTVRGSS